MALKNTVTQMKDYLEQILQLLDHVTEVSVEEFIEAEEFTFDTICVNGEIKFFNICRYRPRRA